MPEQMTGAEMVIEALIDNGVEHIFGYPGGAALPIYDAMFQQDKVQHILVRHEQGAGHMAEGYARSTGKVGVVLVTSGPGVTNVVTPLTDALGDSIPIIVISAQVSTTLIGTDAFQECDTVGITRSCTKHNYLVKSVNDLARVLHEAFHIASSGRPGPVLVDIPKDVQFAMGTYLGIDEVGPSRHKSYHPATAGDASAIEMAVDLMMRAERPIFYTGGGVINSGPAASERLRELADLTGFPVTSTLMGLGAFPGSSPQWMGMLGMHGTYEANMAMHDCDLMINIGARFDDRITGRIDAFSPGSTKIHVDVDPSSINKNVRIDLPVVGDCGLVLAEMVRVWRSRTNQPRTEAIAPWWKQIAGWRAKNSLGFKNSDTVIKPQHAIRRLYEATRGREVFITTEVGQHQMWAAQHFHFDQPNHWMTSGGLGTMGYGLPAAVGVQVAHPDALVIDIAGEASVQMTMQELSTAMQYRLPIKVFILNNERMGMVRQWQDLLHGGRYAHSYSESLPDFVKLAEAMGAKGIKCDDPAKLDAAIAEMLDHDGPVLFDCLVERHENCLPMIPSGKPHNEMILPDFEEDIGSIIDAKGRQLV
ncbi:MAG: acetolactate synthase 3 large subunit [Devosia sp.]|nr:acetolactate synthase 3 large subunit [Devosia sp.]